ncbi:MAG: S-layer homology domain-containing protein [Oscillospiraceae bacterium]|jgi:hypothetical protein|nr:S-layer homology domain-containing protein [Oscillospiraceae bacterium]
MSKKYRRIKKILALTLALVMVLGILPLGPVASAEELADFKLEGGFDFYTGSDPDPTYNEIVLTLTDDPIEIPFSSNSRGTVTAAVAGVTTAIDLTPTVPFEDAMIGNAVNDLTFNAGRWSGTYTLAPGTIRGKATVTLTQAAAALSDSSPGAETIIKFDVVVEPIYVRIVSTTINPTTKVFNDNPASVTPTTATLEIVSAGTYALPNFSLGASNPAGAGLVAGEYIDDEGNPTANAGDWRIANFVNLGSNYEWSSEGADNVYPLGSITPYDLDITALGTALGVNNPSKVFDGKSNAPLSFNAATSIALISNPPGTLTVRNETPQGGLGPSDILLTGSYNDMHVGQNKTISDIKMELASNSNYQFRFGTTPNFTRNRGPVSLDNATGTITQANANVLIVPPNILPQYVAFSDIVAFADRTNYEATGLAKEPVLGLLRWAIDGGGTPVSTTFLSTNKGTTQTFHWTFIPNNANGNYDGHKTGIQSVTIFDGVVLNSNAIRIPGLTSDNVSREYDGTALGAFTNTQYEINFSGIDMGGLQGDNLTNVTGPAAITAWNSARTLHINTVEVTAPAKAYAGITDVDDGKVELRLFSQISANGTNYMVQRVINLEITPRQLVWRDNFVIDKQFDGTTEARPVTGLWFTNVLPAHRNDASLHWDNAPHAHFASPFVGTHRIIDPYGFIASEGGKLEGTQKNNYALPLVRPVFSEGTISPRRVSITPEPNQIKAYGATDPKAFNFSSDLGSYLDWIFAQEAAEDLDNRAAWLGRLPGEAVGSYFYTLNTSAIGENFEVLFGGQGRHAFEIVPAKVNALSNPTQGKIDTDAKVMAWEAYETWRAATTATGAASVQTLVDLAVELGRLPKRVVVNTDAWLMDRFGNVFGDGSYAGGRGTYDLPIDWTTKEVYPHGEATRFGINYPNIIGTLDTSDTKNVEVPTGFETRITLNVEPVLFNAGNYKNDHKRNFADAFILVDSDRDSVNAAGLSELLPTRDSVVFKNTAGGADITVNYEVEWNTTTRLDMRKDGNNATFSGTIRFLDAPWLTVATGMTVTRKITAHNVLPITISASAPSRDYDGLRWAPPSEPPVVMLNYVPVADQPTAFDWKYSVVGHEGSRHGMETAPRDAGSYEAVVSVEPYGNYRRHSEVLPFDIWKRHITITAESFAVDQGQYVGGGLPNLRYTVSGLAPNQTRESAISTPPTFRIAGFNGNVLGSYRINFVTDAVIDTYNFTVGYANGFVTVVEPDAPTFRVSVSGGTVSGGGTFAEYAAGTTVTVRANTNPSGRTFAGWSSTPSVAFASAASRETTFVMPAGEVVVTATFDRIPQAPQTPSIPKEPIFPDLTSGPAFNAVQWAATMKIIEGRDGLFHPKVEMTRSQIVVILHRYAERPNVSATVSFTDVTPGTTIGRAVAWAVSNDITTGRSSTVFGINDIISREALMVMLYRYHTRVLDKSGAASANAIARFSDSGDVSSTALNAMRWAVDNGLLTGQGGKILPKASMTRDQLVTILYRYDKAFN